MLNCSELEFFRSLLVRNARRHSQSPLMIFGAIACAATMSGCNSETAKGATEALVGTAVEVSKGAATGIASGIIEGRKAGESADGARIITKWADLKDVGTITVFKSSSKDGVTEVTLAVENTSANPMRVTNLEVTGIDGDGFVVQPSQKGTRAVTVPSKSKIRHVSAFSTKNGGIKRVRVMGNDLALKK